MPLPWLISVYQPDITDRRVGKRYIVAQHCIVLAPADAIVMSNLKSRDQSNDI